MANSDDGANPQRDQRLEITPALVVERDPQEMYLAIAGLGDQFEQGWAAAWPAAAGVAELRPRSARRSGEAPHSDEAPHSGQAVHTPAAAHFDGVVVCGMGGSAIGADMVRVALPDLPVPFKAVRGYEPPPWTGPNTLLVAVSYSGGTEETLACVASAQECGCAPVCVASGGALAEKAREHDWPLVPVAGGLQPRAAVGYLATAIAAVVARAGLAPDMAGQVAETAAVLREIAGELNPTVPEPYNFAKVLARRLLGRLTVVYGAGVTAPAARRWKSQLNENAKMPAAFGELPELDHNEIVGWEGDADLLERLYVIALEDPLGDERVRRRLTPTLLRARERAAGVELVAARGQSPLARCCSAAYVGDWVSLYLALLAGVDPTPVAPIEELKRTLAGAADGPR